jgi:tol-pal system protein YbgF
MREQVDRLEIEQDKRDPREESAATPPASGAPAGLNLVAARAVQIGEPADVEPVDPNDPEARPELRLTGAPGAAAPRPRSSKSSGRAVIEESDGLRGDATRASVLDPDAKRAYETALAQVQARQYERGLEGLTAFLTRWPDHPYAENAVYWRGEALFSQGEYARAAEQFDAVLSRFGGGNKAPDALLKLGMCHERLGSSARAKEAWDRLKVGFPRSEAAKKIPGRESSTKGPKENR